MSQPKIPKRLSVALGCYLQFPDNAPETVLNEQELQFRSKYKVAFRYRIKEFFFFEFQAQRDRDLFLRTLEAAYETSKIPTRRTILYPTTASAA